MKYYLVLFFLLQFASTFAQDNLKGSLDTVANMDYWNHNAYRMQKEMVQENRVWFPLETKNNASKIAVQQNWGKGNLQPAQGATKFQDLGFVTEGKTNWNKAEFWGKFSYNKSREDSTSLRHQSRWNMDAPYYFGSLRNNQYHRETYVLNAGVQYGFLDRKMPVTLGIDYRLGEYFSNNDPRGTVKDLNAQVELGIGYVQPKLSYHLNGILGFGRERVQIGYKNDKYTANIDDPLYVNWVVNGYGNAEMRLKDINYYDEISRYGLSGHILFTPNKDHKIYVNGRYVKEQQLFKRAVSSELTYEPLSDYNVDKYKLDILWSNQLSSTHKLLISAIGELNRGRDFNHKYMVNNYIFQQQNAGLKVYYQIGKYGVKLSSALIDRHKKDAATGNSMHFTNAVIGLQATANLSFNKHVVFAELGYDRLQNVSGNIVIPTLNASAFTNAIVYHDYLYDTTSQHILHSKWTYLNSALPNWQLSIGIDYKIRDNFKTDNYNQFPTPGKDYYAGQVGVSYLF